MAQKVVHPRPDFSNQVASKVTGVFVRWSKKRNNKPASELFEELDGEVRNALIACRQMWKRFANRQRRLQHKLAVALDQQPIRAQIFECTDDEIRCERLVAQWAIEKWHEIKGTPVPNTQWTDGGSDDIGRIITSLN